MDDQNVIDRARGEGLRACRTARRRRVVLGFHPRERRAIPRVPRASTGSRVHARLAEARTHLPVTTSPRPGSVEAGVPSSSGFSGASMPPCTWPLPQRTGPAQRDSSSFGGQKRGAVKPDYGQHRSRQPARYANTSIAKQHVRRVAVRALYARTRGRHRTCPPGAE